MDLKNWVSTFYFTPKKPGARNFEIDYSVDGDSDESIKRSASDRLGDLVPQVRARTSPGVFRDMALQGLCLELSFSVLPRTQTFPSEKFLVVSNHALLKSFVQRKKQSLPDVRLRVVSIDPSIRKC